MSCCQKCAIFSVFLMGAFCLSVAGCGTGSQEAFQKTGPSRQETEKSSQNQQPGLHKLEKYNRLVQAQANEPLSPLGLSNQIQRFVEGLDSEASVMTSDEIEAELNDLWATQVLRQSVFPSDIVEALQQLETLELDRGGELKRRSFLVGEGGQFPPSHSSLNRTFRYVISWANRLGQAEIFLAVPAGTRDGLMELIAWDPNKRSFNFYRREGANTWMWRGDTRHAFIESDGQIEGSRSNGCFACHTNGSLLMKEQQRPWQNWHSELAGISSEVVPESMRPADVPEIKKLFDEKATAQELEAQVSKGIERSNDSRTEFSNQELKNVRSLFSQILETNNCNLRAAEQKQITATETTRFRLPFELFFDHRVFDKVIDLPIPGFATPISWPDYEELIQDANFRFESGQIEIPGDTFFLGLVPVRAFEDSNLQFKLTSKGIVTKRFLICLAMVDFPNPVFSEFKNSLSEFVSAIPDSLSQDDPLSAQRALVEAIMAAAEGEGPVTVDQLDSASGAQQFAFYWNLAPDDLERVSVEHLTSYLNSVMARSQTPAGQSEMIGLMVQRRRQFQTTIPGTEQAEFALLFPKSNLNNPVARMHRNGKFE